MKGKRGLAGIWQGSAEEASIWSEPDDRFHSVTCCGAELAALGNGVVDRGIGTERPLLVGSRRDACMAASDPKRSLVTAGSAYSLTC